jgi:hypothetical protein
MSPSDHLTPLQSWTTPAGHSKTGHPCQPAVSSLLSPVFAHGRPVQDQGCPCQWETHHLRLPQSTLGTVSLSSSPNQQTLAPEQQPHLTSPRGIPLSQASDRRGGRGRKAVGLVQGNIFGRPSRSVEGFGFLRPQTMQLFFQCKKHPEISD